MGGSSTQEGSSAPVFQTLPGATGETGYGTSTNLFNQAAGMTNAGPNLSPIGSFESYGNVTSPGSFDSYGTPYEGVFGNALEQALLHPTFGASNPNETALLNSLMDVTAGRGAVSGLGAPTQSALATSIAPTLVDLNNQNIQNLTAARGGDITMRGQDITRNLGLRGQDVDTRGQDITRNLGIRGQDISVNAQQIQSWMAALQSLAELAGLAMPQTAAGSTSTSTGKGNSILSDITNIPVVDNPILQPWKLF